jgi:membrane fusion protein (multidrug efflux system)
MRVERISYRFITLATLGVFLAACGKSESAPPAPTPEVGVLTVQPQAIPVIAELPGRTSAFLVAQVRARVDGVVLRREFTEGSDVKEGQRLYQVDPAPYVAQLNSAKAALAKAQANLAAHDALVARYKVLVLAHAISRQQYDDAVAAQGQASADVAAGKAAVDAAQINLGYTNVLSPIAGRVGISQVTPGAYVQASQATLMSTVQQLDRVYVDLTQSSLEGLKLRQDALHGHLQTNGPDAAPVTLILEDGKPYPQPGKLQFADVTVDQATGSVTLRAVFPNPQHVLLPGMFVRAHIELGTKRNAFLVPQTAVAHDQKGLAFAWVVGADNAVAARPLATAGMRGRDWIVEGGLQAGDRVIVEGIDKVRPGAIVKAVPAQLAPAGHSLATVSSR